MLQHTQLMIINQLSSQPITSSEQLTTLLLERIPETARHSFFTPPHPSVLSAEEAGLNLTSLQQAAQRLRQAITNQETVVIYGDYDCDGITGTAILWETLHHLGLNARPFLPHRERHGYGLAIAGLIEIWEKTQPSLLVTVDNGIVAHQAAAWLKAKGTELIITDHHEPDDHLPIAGSIVHSTKLCGATVAWFLARELDPAFVQQELDLAVIGTIADQVPLYGANRSFAYHGLAALRQTQRVSLRILADLAGIKLDQADAHTIHFGLAPRLNAMGRLYEALDALRALVAKTPQRATNLMRQLQETNRERQDLTAQAMRQVQLGLPADSPDPLIVVAGDYHPGIIGLIASKLVEQTGKPSIVLSLVGKQAKASGRSVVGFHLTNFLRDLNQVEFLSLGGHAMAAGFTINNQDLSKLKQEITTNMQKKINLASLKPQLSVLGPLAPNLLVRTTAELIAEFSPFGAGNEEPLFILPDVEIKRVKPVGREKNHAQINFTYQGTPQKGICFSYQDRGYQAVLSRADLVFTLSLSDFPGQAVELQVRHFLPNSG